MSCRDDDFKYEGGTHLKQFAKQVVRHECPISLLQPNYSKALRYTDGMMVCSSVFIPLKDSE